MPAVVSIPPVESLKMFAYSVVWGSWTVVKNAVVRLVVDPLLFGSRKSATVTEGRYVPSHRDRPPPCLSATSYGAHSYAKVKGVKFHYIESGNPKDMVLLLLHGFPSCWISWYRQIPILSNHFRVIAVDLKGFGDSDKPSARRSYKVESLVNELVVFLSILGVDELNKCHVIGHDLGALLGWYLVYLWPNYVSKFVAISCPHPNVHWEHIPKSSYFNKNWICFSQLPYLPEMDALQNDLDIINQCYQHLNKTKQTDDSAYIDAYKYTFSRKEDWTGAINYFRNLPFNRIESPANNTSKPNREEDMLQVPCLLITGGKDVNIKMKSLILSTEYLKSSTLRIVDNASHFPHQEQPEVVNYLLTSFLVPVNVVDEESQAPQPSGIVGRMKGMVTKYGNTLKDTVQRRSLLL